MMRKLLLLLALLWAGGFSVAASAQIVEQRFLPANAERGTLGERQAFPLVEINRRTLRLAPGARIFDQANRTIVHAHLPAGAEIVYAREASGDVSRIYILTEQEIARLRQAGKR